MTRIQGLETYLREMRKLSNYVIISLDCRIEARPIRVPREAVLVRIMMTNESSDSLIISRGLIKQYITVAP